MTTTTYVPGMRGQLDDAHTSDCGCRCRTILEGLCPTHWLAGWPTVDELLAHDARTEAQRRAARAGGYDRAALLREAARGQPPCIACGRPAVVRGLAGAYCAACFPRAELG